MPTNDKHPADQPADRTAEWAARPVPPAQPAQPAEPAEQAEQVEQVEQAEQAQQAEQAEQAAPGVAAPPGAVPSSSWRPWSPPPSS